MLLVSNTKRQQLQILNELNDLQLHSTVFQTLLNNNRLCIL